MDPNALRPLVELRPGERAEVAEIDASLPLAERLRELGFLRGTEVAMLRRAPLGDPSVYAIRGAKLCLRRSEAAAIRVRPTAASR